MAEWDRPGDGDEGTLYEPEGDEEGSLYEPPPPPRRGADGTYGVPPPPLPPRVPATPPAEEEGTLYDPEAIQYRPPPRPGAGTRGYSLDITGLVRRTFEALGSEAASLAGIGLLVYAPMVVVVGLLMMRVVAGVDTPEEAEFYDSLLFLFGNFFFVQLVSGGAIVLLFARFQGHTVSIGAAVRAAMQRLVSLVGLSLMVGFTVGVGILLCVIPGFIFQAALGLAVPALMVEDLRAGEAFSRSWELTKGHRWAIFVIQLFFSIVGGILVTAETAGLAYLLPDPQTYVLAYLPISLLSSIFLGVVNAVAMVLIYHDLRLAKEGIDEESLVAAFA